MASVKVVDSRQCWGSVGNHTFTGEITAKPPRSVYHLLHEVVGPGHYMASVKVVDSRQCWGSVGNHTFTGEITAKPPRSVYHLLHEVVGPGHYMASVKVVDSRQCWGSVGNHTFTVSENNELAVTGFTKNEVVWMTMLPSVTVALALCVALVKMWQRCFLWLNRRLHPQPPHWTGIYKPISLDSGRSARVTFPHLHQRNILYVEKEIEEARQKGEADGYEVSYNRLALGRQIGKGAFGRVFLARAEAIAGVAGSSIVAVKKLKHKATVDEVEEFLQEISMMKKVGHHPNIVTMVGCCTLTHPYCMIMEYVPCGDLLAYLRQLRSQHDRYRQLQQFSVAAGSSVSSDCSYITPLPPPSCASSVQPSTRCSAMSSIAVDGITLEVVLDPRELHSFASQIARGMSYLEAKQITHRDLAARNILIDERKTLKISDFGLSRSGIYVNTKRRKVPLRWLSVEAMRDSLYSSKSDVWAFGVVLWEIGTLGGFPYPTVSDHELLAFLLSGKRLEKPDNISDELQLNMSILGIPVKKLDLFNKWLILGRTIESLQVDRAGIEKP
ncbi:fibroblast growth factor receptor-like [Macrosteles quadrilineatus]|uniref:fibroblast growth factor receptor-like n=1 Tax=Macrosteles quadrilineatus TaxID=74068 RepID=UPI0023E101B8|nr:fibroblast growth factor receptor-like [Macrosteles quadrilineatus]